MNTCYRYEHGNFVEAQYPLDSTVDDWDRAISRAGYYEQIQMPTNNALATTVATVYQHENDKGNAPHFLISVWGRDLEMALLVADDFGHLLKTLAAIEPLARYSTYMPD